MRDSQKRSAPLAVAVDENCDGGQFLKTLAKFVVFDQSAQFASVVVSEVEFRGGFGILRIGGRRARRGGCKLWLCVCSV